MARSGVHTVDDGGCNVTGEESASTGTRGLRGVHDLALALVEERSERNMGTYCHPFFHLAFHDICSSCFTLQAFRAVVNVHGADSHPLQISNMPVKKFYSFNIFTFNCFSTGLNQSSTTHACS